MTTVILAGELWQFWWILILKKENKSLPNQSDLGGHQQMILLKTHYIVNGYTCPLMV
jgi:hypothetical protein